MGNLMSKKKEANETTAWGINQKDQEATQWASRGEVLGNMATRKYDNTDDKPPRQYSRKKTGDKSLKKDEERRTRSTTRTAEQQIGSRSGTLGRRSGSRTGTGDRRTRSTSRTGGPRTRSTSGTLERRTACRTGTLERHNGSRTGTLERRSESRTGTGDWRTRSTSRSGEPRTRSISGTIERRTGSRTGTLERRTGSRTGTLERRNGSRTGTLERNNGSRTGTLERRTGSTSGTGSVRSTSNVSGSGPIYPWKQETSLDTRIDCQGRKIKSQSQTVVTNTDHQETSQEVYQLGHSRWRSDESDEGTPTYKDRYESKSVYSDKQMSKHSPATKNPESRRHQLYFGQQHEYYVGY